MRAVARGGGARDFVPLFGLCDEVERRQRRRRLMRVGALAAVLLAAAVGASLVW